MSVDGQMDEDGMIHIYKGILFCHEKEGILPFEKKKKREWTLGHHIK